MPLVDERPRVTAVLPVHNGAATIEAAVRSVMEQTLADFELLVIDDASTDDTRQIVGQLAATDRRVQLFAESRHGLVGTPNLGIARARGTYIARMDADDICLPERFARQVAYLDTHPDCVTVGAEILKVDANNRPREGAREPRTISFAADPCAFPPRAQSIAQPTAMMRADVLAAIGGYRELFAFGGEDRDLWWRLGERGRIHVLPEILLRYRVHEGSISRRRRRDMLLSRLRADLAAICRGYGIDDVPPLAATFEATDATEILAAFAPLIGDRYPVETLCLYYLVKERAWRLAGFASRRQMLARVVAHAVASPLAAGRRELVAAMISNGFKSHRPIDLAANNGSLPLAV